MDQNQEADRLGRIAKNGKPNLDGLENVDAKIRHEYQRRTGTLDEIQGMVL
jgi:hypothetical protein